MRRARLRLASQIAISAQGGIRGCAAQMAYRKSGRMWRNLPPQLEKVRDYLLAPEALSVDAVTCGVAVGWWIEDALSSYMDVRPHGSREHTHI